MIVSSDFNRKFHATLGDIISSGKTIKIDIESSLVTIDTRKIDIEGLKILFKVLDLDYPRFGEKPPSRKTILSNTKLDKLYVMCGYPRSMTDLRSGELSHHLEWIQFVCSENNITLHDQSWDMLLQKAKEYDN